jgi:putative peptidoglycan lipid II flippase
LPGLWESWLLKAGTLAAAGLLGLLAYLVAARLLRVREVSEVVHLVRRRLGR